MSIVTTDTSSTELLARLRGTLTRARVTASGRVELAVEDPTGGNWRLVSWEATCFASDPERLNGRSITGVELMTDSGLLTVNFSDGSELTLTPNGEGDDEAVEDWELFTPEGLRLAYGPWGQCHLGRSSGIDEGPPPRPSGPEMTTVRDSRQWKQACREIGLDDEERELASKDLHAWHLADGERQ